MNGLTFFAVNFSLTLSLMFLLIKLYRQYNDKKYPWNIILMILSKDRRYGNLRLRVEIEVKNKRKTTEDTTQVLEMCQTVNLEVSTSNIKRISIQIFNSNYFDDCLNDWI